MKEKSIKKVLSDGKRTTSSAGMVKVQTDNGFFSFPKKQEEEILNKKYRSSGPTKMDLNKRCNEIQKWLVRMQSNKNILNGVLSKKNMTLKEQARLFLKRTWVKQSEITPFSMECCEAAFSMIPKAWIDNKKQIRK